MFISVQTIAEKIAEAVRATGAFKRVLYAQASNGGQIWQMLEALANLPAVMRGANGTKVIVGPENVADELKDSSVVMTKFDIGEGMQGVIGVVGPTRMDYAKVTARLSYFAESLSKMFTKPETPQLPEGEQPQK